MATTLYLIRHGATLGSEVLRYKGSLDVPLSDEGVRQVERTAEFVKTVLNGSELKTVYSSDLIRAVRSAEIIGGNAKPNIVPELRERNFGLWEGMSFTEIKEKYPAEFAAWAGDPLKFSPPGGESTIEVRDRAVKAFEKITETHEGESVAIVAHGGVNRVILCHVLGIPLENIFRIEQYFAAVNIIEFHDGYPVVKLINGGETTPLGGLAPFRWSQTL